MGYVVKKALLLKAYNILSAYGVSDVVQKVALLKSYNIGRAFG